MKVPFSSTLAPSTTNLRLGQQGVLIFHFTASNNSLYQGKGEQSFITIIIVLILYKFKNSPSSHPLTLWWKRMRFLMSEKYIFFNAKLCPYDPLHYDETCKFYDTHLSMANLSMKVVCEKNCPRIYYNHAVNAQHQKNPHKFADSILSVLQIEIRERRNKNRTKNCLHPKWVMMTTIERFQPWFLYDFPGYSGKKNGIWAALKLYPPQHTVQTNFLSTSNTRQL